MIACVTVLALLTLLVATEPEPRASRVAPSPLAGGPTHPRSPRFRLYPSSPLGYPELDERPHPQAAAQGAG